MVTAGLVAVISLGQPLGLWALAAVPLILAIHFLQRQTRRVEVSTLFLLEHLAPESVSGRRWERLRHSVPLWMQLLAALLLTWLLVEPSWVRENSSQRVAVVLDSSLSMHAFRSEVLRQLPGALEKVSEAAALTEWVLLESDAQAATLYAGPNLPALVETLARWKPHLGAHDFTPTLQVGQALLRGEGAVILVTDRRVPVPEGVHVLSYGQQLQNCGWTGATVEGRRWSALLKNHGAEPQRRSWHWEHAGQRTPVQEVQLEPGQLLTLEGEFPPGTERGTLVLAPDAFALDDQLPLLVPALKPLAVQMDAALPAEEFWPKWLSALPAVSQAAGGMAPDLRLAAYDPLLPRLPAGHAIVLMSDPAPGGRVLGGEVVAESHPLTQDLNWGGLLCRETIRVPALSGDVPLVWVKERPLIFLRPAAGGQLLVVNFDVRAANATRLPAFVLLLHRFAERVREGLVKPEVRNVETNQALEVTGATAGPALTLNGQTMQPLRAPAEPGFFAVKQGDRTLLQAAAQFADAREADFRTAAPANDLRPLTAKLVERSRQPLPWYPAWLAALGAVLAVSWMERRRA